MRGTVGSADRAQRLVMGLLLMGLNLFGLFQSPELPKWIALALQLELVLTGLIGWCPFYWSFGVGFRDDQKGAS